MRGDYRTEAHWAPGQVFTIPVLHFDIQFGAAVPQNLGDFVNVLSLPLLRERLSVMALEEFFVFHISWMAANTSP